MSTFKKEFSVPGTSEVDPLKVELVLELSIKMKKSGQSGKATFRARIEPLDQAAWERKGIEAPSLDRDSAEVEVQINAPDAEARMATYLESLIPEVTRKLEALTIPLKAIEAFVAITKSWMDLEGFTEA